MGKATGFLEFERKEGTPDSPRERIKDFKDFHSHLSREDQKKQGGRCMDCGTPYCQFGGTVGDAVAGCPLNNLIPEWNDLIFRGNYKEAYKRLHKTSSFPEFTSRVCPALCEKACTCSLNGMAVTVNENEYAIIEYAFENGLIEADEPKTRTGKKVAIVGSGPAGLACADMLNARGHLVTVFEKDDRPGGLLMYGIPNMKLDKDIVMRRIGIMEKSGIIFKCNTDIGKDLKVSDLKKDYDAVVLACGARTPRDSSAKGRDAKGIYFAVDFLAGITKSLLDSNLKDNKYISCKDKHVVVIGGGDTGNDCVASAVRLGAKSVTQIGRRPKPPVHRTEDNPWPEKPKVLVTGYGQEEAEAVYGHDPRIYDTTVSEFIKDANGNVKALKLVKVQFHKESGKEVMEVIKNSESEIPCDIVFMAGGFSGCEEYVFKDTKVKVKNGKVQVKDYMTAESGVYAAGDIRKGASLVVYAIKEGREAARAVDKSLLGYSNL